MYELDKLNSYIKFQKFHKNIVDNDNDTAFINCLQNCYINDVKIYIIMTSSFLPTIT